MLDAVVLEWEGVLADTRAARREALVRAFAAEGIAVDSARAGREREGRTIEAAVAALLSGVAKDDPTLVDLVSARATRTYAEHLAQGMTLLPGARAFIERAQISAPVAIVTCATRTETAFMLQLAGLEGAIVTVVSADDALPPPPAAGMYDRAIDTLNRRRPLQRERAVALAPNARAVRGARAAGLRVAAVGAPAHVSLEAEGAVERLDGLTVRELAAVCGVVALERFQ